MMLETLLALAVARHATTLAALATARSPRVRAALRDAEVRENARVLALARRCPNVDADALYAPARE